jgi:molybdopterin-guanine dinucleotide biosynthesis protein A
VGGEARRAEGREKYFFSYDGTTFIERLLNTLRQVVDEIVVVARNEEQCSRFSAFSSILCTKDVRQGIGPIGGLHAGVLAASGDLVFVSACDMPCIHGGVVDYLFNAIDGYDAVIPSWNDEMLEPLHAVYRRESLLSYLASHESLSLRAMIRSLDARYLPVDELRGIDPTLKTFTNINKIEELDAINTR